MVYRYSLRGYEEFLVYLQKLMDGINFGKHNRREPYVFVVVMGRFKEEAGIRIHLLPLVNVTPLGIRIRIWLDRLVALLKEEGKTNCPALCDMEVYMLSAAATQSVFHPIMEEIQIHRDRNLADSIPRGMNDR